MLQDSDAYIPFSRCLASEAPVGFFSSSAMLYHSSVRIPDRDKVGADAHRVEEHRRRPRQQAAQGRYLLVCSIPSRLRKAPKRLRSLTMALCSTASSVVRGAVRRVERNVVAFLTEMRSDFLAELGMGCGMLLTQPRVDTSLT